MQNLSQEYLTLISRQARTVAAGTVAKPATLNTRSDAASTNEAATAVAGATVSEKAGPDTLPGGSIPAATEPAWKAACKVENVNRGGLAWWAVLSPTRKHWWSPSNRQWYPVLGAAHGGVFCAEYAGKKALDECTTCPPDWPTPAHTDDPREEPERFCEATGPMPSGDERKPYPFGIVVKGDSCGWNIYSASGNYCWDRFGWVPAKRIDLNAGGRAHLFDCLRDADEAAYKIDEPPPDRTDDPREATEPMAYEVTYPDGRTEKLDKLPRTEMPQAFTTAKPKPCESIERLVDRLAKVNGAIEVSYGMAYRVTGNVEKAEPRSWDTPGYPAHFSLHHVYMPEDWTRGVLMSIAYGLEGKLDKGTIRTVLEQVSRSLVLTGEMDEADLIGLAVAVEDKLDIGK